MRTRLRSGRYTPHNTPGDGTGFSKVPTTDDPTTILEDVDRRGEVMDQPYPTQHSTPVRPGKE